MSRQVVFIFVVLGLVLLGIVLISRGRRGDHSEPFVAKPRQLMRTFTAPMTKWYSIFKITRISPRDPRTTYESNQVIVRTPGARAARSNVYPFSFVSQTVKDPRALTISQVSAVTSKRKELGDGDELEPVQARLPVFVRIQRSTIASRAHLYAYLQVRSDADLRGVYQCILQSYDPSMKLEAIQPPKQKRR